MSTLKQLSLHLIKRHPLNPRQEFDEAEIKSLADSMKEVGLIEPIVVRPYRPRTKFKYELVAGERRMRAAELLGWSTIPCLVKDISDAESLTIQLVENLQRVDLNPIDIGRGIERLCRPTSESGAGKTQVEVGQVLGKSEAWVSVHIGLLRLPKAWQDRVATGEISSAQGWKALIPFADKPVVLARIEADIADNPWAYRTGDNFVENVQRIAAEVGQPGKWLRSSAPQKPTQRQPKAADAKTREQIESAEEDTTLECVVPSPVDNREHRVEAILAAIAELEDADDLARLLSAIQERIEAVAAVAHEMEAATA